jgi:hypothetical protein
MSSILSEPKRFAIIIFRVFANIPFKIKKRKVPRTRKVKKRAVLE